MTAIKWLNADPGDWLASLQELVLDYDGVNEVLGFHDLCVDIATQPIISLPCFSSHHSTDDKEEDRSSPQPDCHRKARSRKQQSKHSCNSGSLAESAYGIWLRAHIRGPPGGSTNTWLCNAGEKRLVGELTSELGHKSGSSNGSEARDQPSAKVDIGEGDQGSMHKGDEVAMNQWNKHGGKAHHSMLTIMGHWSKSHAGETSQQGSNAVGPDIGSIDCMTTLSYTRVVFIRRTVNSVADCLVKVANLFPDRYIWGFSSPDDIVIALAADSI